LAGIFHAALIPNTFTLLINIQSATEFLKGKVMAKYKIPPVGNCTEADFQQQLVDYHELPVNTFVNMILDYFETYPFPAPYVLSKIDLEIAINGINCEYEVMRLSGSFTEMNNDDIVYSIGIPLDHNYSIGLLRGILDRFPAAQSFHFYKAFCPTSQQFSIIFQVWDGVTGVYCGDFTTTLP
jgi:hypothetical protein